MPSTPHELVIFANGTASVRPVGAAEPMHSSIGAWEEAGSLYVRQSGLRERLGGGGGPLVLYDVGMGIAANALAAARVAAQAGGRGLRIVSFENDLGGLGLALRHAERFPFFEGWDGALEAIVTSGRWQGPGVEWELREGDWAAQPLGQPEPELVFYDFYSPKTSAPALWGHGSFARLHAACARRRADGSGTTLYTYSSSTAARAAMLLAGFHVGAGDATEGKRETTVAATRLEDLLRPLGREWLDKLSRSGKPLPEDWPAERRAEGFERIAARPQFR